MFGRGVGKKIAFLTRTLLLKLKEVALNTPVDFFCDYVRG